MEIKTRCKKKSQVVQNLYGIVLFQDKKYSIEICRTGNKDIPKYELVVVTDALYTNWVMVYANGNVAYSNHVTLYIHKLVQKYAKKYFDILKPAYNKYTIFWDNLCSNKNN